MILVSLLTSIFPYDAKIDSPLDHQHLVIAYCITWTVQLGYLLYVCRKWYSGRPPDRQTEESNLPAVSSMTE